MKISLLAHRSLGMTVVGAKLFEAEFTALARQEAARNYNDWLDRQGLARQPDGTINYKDNPVLIKPIEGRTLFGIQMRVVQDFPKKYIGLVNDRGDMVFAKVGD